jgi:metallo-beta-lactamase class B
MTRVLGACVVAVSIAVAAAAQSSADVERHVAAARAAAGSDHLDLFNRICTEATGLSAPPAGRGGGRAGGGARQGGPPPPPSRDQWHLPPAKVFDNLYYVGMTEFSAWAVTTSAGIILIDAVFDYSVEGAVVEGLQTLGLSPADIRYVLISHGHLDHAGGAKLLQERYGARVIMSAADWELVERQNPPWLPKRDLVATDGQQLTLGDTTLTLYLTPGHTEGTVSTLVPVFDGGRRHLAAAWGGTAFNFGPNRERLTMYADSAARFRDIVTKAGADVLISNHTSFDGTRSKLPMLASRKPGEPHSFVVGTDTVRRYLTVAHECASAALAGL